MGMQKFVNIKFFCAMLSLPSDLGTHGILKMADI